MNKKPLVLSLVANLVLLVALTVALALLGSAKTEAVNRAAPGNVSQGIILWMNEQQVLVYYIDERHFQSIGYLSLEENTCYFRAYPEEPVTKESLTVGDVIHFRFNSIAEIYPPVFSGIETLTVVGPADQQVLNEVLEQYSAQLPAT